jgi:hypothetical protein
MYSKLIRETLDHRAASPTARLLFSNLERFVEIFAAVLLAAENPNTAHDEIGCAPDGRSA